MMDKDALQYLAAMAARGPVDENGRVMSVPQAMSIFSMEQYDDQPWRTRKVFEASDLMAFVTYMNDQIVAANPGDNPTVYVGDENILGVVDHGTHGDPRWGEHRAVLPMRRKPEVTALQQISTTSVINVKEGASVDQMIAFVEDCGPLLSFYQDTVDDEPTPARKMLSRLQNMRVKLTREAKYTQSEHSEGLGLMAQADVTAGGQRPPSLMVLSTPFYEGLDDPIDIFVTIRTREDSDGKPVISLRVMRYAETERLAQTNFQKKIRNTLHEQAMVYRGATTSRHTG